MLFLPINTARIVAQQMITVSIDKRKLSEAAVLFLESSPDFHALLEMGAWAANLFPAPEPTGRAATEIIAMAPAVTGRIGEAEVEAALRSEFGALKYVAHTSHSGDFIIMLGGVKIVIEVKNYSTPVGGQNTAKFWRDIESTSAAAGVFISLNTPIAHVTNDFTIKYETIGESVVPCCYVVSREPPIMISAVKMAASLSLALSRIRANQSTLEDNVKILESGLQSLAGVKGRMRDNVAEIIGGFNKISSDLGATEATLKGAVNKIKIDMQYDIADDQSAAMDMLDKQGVFGGRLLQTREFVRKFIAAIDGRYNDPLRWPRQWYITKGRCRHCTGLEIKFMASGVWAIVSRDTLDREAMFSLLDNFGKKIKIGAKGLSVKLDTDTIDWCVRLVENI